MNKLLEECIIACENCVVGCLKMNNTLCVNECIVCERVCKTLKVANKCGVSSELLKSLKNSCKLACKECSIKCKTNDMACCKKCLVICEKLYVSLSSSTTKTKTKLNKLK